MSTSFGPAPDPSRISRYYDDPIEVGVWFTLFWAIFGMFIGVWAAAQHTTGVIFGFGGNALIATSFHVIQRTSRARLADQVSPRSTRTSATPSGQGPARASALQPSTGSAGAIGKRPLPVEISPPSSSWMGGERKLGRPAAKVWLAQGNRH